ncbi:MAG TPA: GNAT family N-acetyltransferase [Spirochaetia bacterium]|nr:GNAT family N-acetyltransferase [Spirochaetales bacterium]HRY79445.1 GNAT family N-acetyltransferase [Spirochaetia bacterium]HRZ88636.1 GNAT family N-acetyltransferase [Spirochaetia bacterium]
MIEILAVSPPIGDLEIGLRSFQESCGTRDGTIRLETEFALNAFTDMRALFLARDSDRLVGALSVFAPTRHEAEINAAVLPDRRRGGIFRSLLSEAERELARFGYAEELFVVDSGSGPGKEAAARLGGTHEYTEYTLRYAGPCPEVPARDLEIRRVGSESLEDLVDLRSGAFGDSREETEAFERATLASPERQVYAAFLGDRMAGACSLGFQGREVSINGLVTAVDLRGRGYAQSLLARIVRTLESEGYGMTLDVESRNADALHVYTKLGFLPERAVEYWRRSLPV